MGLKGKPLEHHSNIVPGGLRGTPRTSQQYRTGESKGEPLEHLSNIVPMDFKGALNQRPICVACDFSRRNFFLPKKKSAVAIIRAKSFLLALWGTFFYDFFQIERNYERS